MNKHASSSWFPEDVPKGAITLEEGKAHPPVLCDCCRTRSLHVVGFLSRADYACAVYQASWTEGHVADDGVRMTLSVGGWAGSDYPRTRIALLCWIEDDSVSMMVLDPFDEHGNPRHWNDDKPYFGPFVRRDEALRHPDMPDIFRLAGHVVSHDKRVNTALFGHQDD